MTSPVERKEQPVTSLETIFCLSLFLPHDGDIISRRKKFPAGEKKFCSDQVCSHSTRKCFLCLPSASTAPPFSRLPSLCKVRTELWGSFVREKKRTREVPEPFLPPDEALENLSSTRLGQLLPYFPSVLAINLHCFLIKKMPGARNRTCDCSSALSWPW